MLAKQEKEDVAFRRIVQETAQSCGVSSANGALEFLAGKIGAHPRLGVEETKKRNLALLGEDGSQITEQLIIELVPDFGEGDFLKRLKLFLRKFKMDYGSN